MSTPTLDELRLVVQPPEKMALRNGEHWAGRLYMRRISLRTTRLLINSPISANGYTYLMTLSGMASGAALLVPGVAGAVLGALFMQGYLLLDCVDGELARWRKEMSITGVYLDRIGAYLTEASFFTGLGFRASGLHTNLWAVLGLATAVAVVLVKSETDLVDVARARAGLPAVTESAAEPTSRGVAKARALASAFKIHRLIGGIEASLLVIAVAVADLFAHGRPFTQATVALLAFLSLAMVVLHFVSIVKSSRLNA